MNKSELILEVSERTGLSKKDAASAISAVFDSITESLAREEKVQVVGFGTFEIKYRAKRTGRNPLTGQPVPIPPTKQASLRPAKRLRDTVK